MELEKNPVYPSVADPNNCSSPVCRGVLADSLAPAAGKKKHKQKRKPKQKQLQKHPGNIQEGVIICGSEHGCADILIVEAGIFSNFDHVDELDQDTLFPLQQGSNLEINEGVVGRLPVSYADFLKCGIKNSSADSARTPPIVSPGPLNDLTVLETSCGDPKTDNCEQHQLVLPDSVKAIAPDALAHTDFSTPPGEVQGVEALNFSSIYDGISEDSQESKLKNLSPLARKVAARINTLLRAVDKSAHKDEALHGLASSPADNLSPRTQDSSLMVKKSMIKKHSSWKLSHLSPLLVKEKEVENWVLRKTRASYKGQG